MENLRSLGARTIHNPRMAFPSFRPIPMRRREAWRHRHGLRRGARLFAFLLAAALTAAPLRAAPALVAASAPPPNAANARLAGSPSPYLRMHAADPVHWRPWNEATLQQARRENKLIFVTVGFYACFWCHEMDRTVFSDPGVAAQMNRDFVNVVIDREQRPDLDQAFVLAREILDRGRSGWPNNLVLTPQGLPFAAFGVLPAHTTKEQPGFAEVLQRIHATWARDPGIIAAQARKVRGAMREVQQASSQPGVIVPGAWRAEALAAARKSFDPLDGGFDAGADRFPHAPLLEFLQGSGDAEAQAMVNTTLRAMAEGGLMDQLDGGFHRYAIDPQWSVPHFEKMLGDNAQLLALYTQAAKQNHDPLFAQVAARTAAFLLARMRLPDDSFASSLSSETGGVEGAPYTWNEAQIHKVLGTAAAARFLRFYALVPLPPEPGSDRQPDAGALRIRPAASHGLNDAGLAVRIDQLAPLRARLLAARQRRPQAARDDKAVLAGNGLAVAALAEAGVALQRPAWVQAAARGAQSLWHSAWAPQTRTLAHEVVAGRAGGPGLLADYALYGQGLLALHRATGKAVWLARAETLAAAMHRRFATPDGSLRSTWDASLPVAPAGLGDSHEPSAQSAAIAFWLQLAQATKKTGYALDARLALASFAGFVQRAPVGFGSLLAALDANGQAALDAADKTPQRRPAEDSARVVQASARVQTAEPGTPAQLHVELVVATGYHVNTNPASMPYLIPTTVLIGGQPAPGVRYPPGRMLRLQTGLQLAVLEGRIDLAAPLAGPPPGRVQVRVQACDDHACLPPSTLDVAVAPAP